MTSLHIGMNDTAKIPIKKVHHLEKQDMKVHHKIYAIYRKVQDNLFLLLFEGKIFEII